jgi:hypothetical protein
MIKMIMDSSDATSPSESDDAADEEDTTLATALRAELERCRLPLRDFSPLPDDRQGYARSDRPSECLSIAHERLPVIASVRLVMHLTNRRSPVRAS